MRNPKNIAKHGYQYDTKKMTKQQALCTANIVISAIFFACFLWMSFGLLFWQGLFICAINQVKKPQAILENHFMGPAAGPTLPQAQNREGTIQYIAVQPNQVQPQYVQP